MHSWNFSHKRVVLSKFSLSSISKNRDVFNDGSIDSDTLPRTAPGVANQIKLWKKTGTYIEGY